MKGHYESSYFQKIYAELFKGENSSLEKGEESKVKHRCGKIFTALFILLSWVETLFKNKVEEEFFPAECLF